jgi:hypothetical protein
MTEQMKRLMGIPANTEEMAAYEQNCRAVDALWRERAAEEKFGFGSKEHRQAVNERFKAWGLK